MNILPQKVAEKNLTKPQYRTQMNKTIAKKHSNHTEPPPAKKNQLQILNKQHI